MRNFVHYTALGEIFAYGFAPDDSNQAQKDCFTLDVDEQRDWKLTHYIDLTGTPTLTPRPTLTPTVSGTTVAANGVDTITISGLPNPATISVTGPNNAAGETTTGEVELSFDVPGEYTVTITAFPYLPFEVLIHAT